MPIKRKTPASENNKSSDSQRVPKPNFHKFDLIEDMGIPSSYIGYDNWVPFNRPEGHYLRLNVTSPEPEKLVEYDLDLEDRAWLEAYFNNVSLEQIPDKVIMAFEFTIDSLEKKWFYLTRNIESSTRTEQSTLITDDRPCEICGETDCDNSNAIIFCDGCDLVVHQECYGVPFIPEGQWLCRKCMLSPSNPVKCVLCPNEGGAYKQTSSNSWAHLTCALWIPEVSFGDTIYMEPIEGTNKIPKSRKKLKCYLCKRHPGACIQCAFKTCSKPFHVTCAKTSNLCMKYKLTKGSVSMRAYCNRHTPKDYKKQIDTKAMQKVPYKKPGSNTTKSKLARSRKINSSKVIIPQTIYDSVYSGITKFKVRRSADFLTDICKYWSLKKESCCGALLIKRLHLEPRTECPKILQTEEEKVAVYGVLKKVKIDLERVRTLAELVRKREACRLNILRITQEYWEAHFFPQTRIIRDILNQMIKLDTNKFFLDPVSKELAPDYYDHIKSPMDLGTLSKLVNGHEIITFDQFKEKLLLVYTNCQFFNSKATTYYKVATRHLKKAHELFDSVANQIPQLNIDPKSGFLLSLFDHNSCFTNDSLPHISISESNFDLNHMDHNDKCLDEPELLDAFNYSDSELSNNSCNVIEAVGSSSPSRRFSPIIETVESTSPIRRFSVIEAERSISPSKRFSPVVEAVESTSLSKKFSPVIKPIESTSPSRRFSPVIEAVESTSPSRRFSPVNDRLLGSLDDSTFEALPKKHHNFKSKKAKKSKISFYNFRNRRLKRKILGKLRF